VGASDRISARIGGDSSWNTPDRVALGQQANTGWSSSVTLSMSNVDAFGAA
jgi:hypothetical protein